MKTNIPMGKAVLAIQESFGVTSDEMARLLRITPALMTALEKDEEFFSEELCERFEEAFGIDLFIAGACLSLPVERMPGPLRDASARLFACWDQMLARVVEQFKASRS